MSGGSHAALALFLHPRMFREAVNRARRHERPDVSTKSRILETALDLFNAEGFGALSAVDVAAALGISPGHLY